MIMGCNNYCEAFAIILSVCFLIDGALVAFYILNMLTFSKSFSALFAAIMCLVIEPAYSLQPMQEQSRAEHQEPTSSISVKRHWEESLPLTKAIFTETMQEELDAISDELKATGPVEKDWLENTVDIKKYLSSLPPAAAGVAIYSDSEVFGALEFYSKLPEGLLDGWQLVQSGPKYTSDSENIVLIQLGAAHILATSLDEPDLRIGNARCHDIQNYDTTQNSAIFRDGSFPFDADDESITALEFEAQFLAELLFEGFRRSWPVSCTVYRLRDDGKISSTIYTSEGAPLIEMNAGTSNERIVRNIEIREFFKKDFVNPIFTEDEELSSVKD